MAQLVMCFLCEHEDLSLIPRTCLNQPGMVVYTHPSGVGELEKGTSLELHGLSSFPYLASSRPVRNPDSKINEIA